MLFRIRRLTSRLRMRDRSLRRRGSRPDVPEPTLRSIHQRGLWLRARHGFVGTARPGRFGVALQAVHEDNAIRGAF